MAGLVVIGTKSLIVEKVAAHIHAPVIEFHLDWFADTEPSITLEQQEKLINKTAIVVFQIDLMFEYGNAYRSINDHIAGFLHIVSAIKIAGATSIIAVLPYLPYARQEKDPSSTQPGPLGMWAKVFKAAGIDHVITCDIHSSASVICMGNMLTDISVAHFWAERIKGVVPSDVNLQNDLCIVSPDNGGINRAIAIANELGCSHTFVDKVRIAKDNPVALGLTGNAKGKVAVIVDDILDTGGTASNACQLLHAHGVQMVLGCFTHAVFSHHAGHRLASAGFEKILITDTLTSAIKQEGVPLQICSVADYFADHVQRIIKHI